MIQRGKIVPLAFGNVLEIGIGSGLNLSFYNINEVESVIGIDPSVENWGKNDLDIDSLLFKFKFIEAPVENLPFEGNCFDSVLVTYSLCTIPDIEMAFQELRRVLKPNGVLVFCEHGKAPDPAVAGWQNIINPVWKKIGGGCNLNRDIPSLIISHGFKMNQMDSAYIPGWKPASYNYWGTATIK